MQLNSAQQEAVESIDGPVLVIAGAGSGKTRILVHRILKIIKDKKANPWEIMAVTFTNKAAGELKQRIKDLVGESANYIQVGTFHSICARILRRHADMLNYESNFVIYDTEDKVKLLRNILKEMEIDNSVLPPKSCARHISTLKNKFIFPYNFNEYDGNEELPEALEKVYDRYQKELLYCNSMDFDDLLVLVVKLFEKDEDLLLEYQNKIKYILVDEYQDTNFVQDSLVAKIGDLYKNICVVGDEDQAIYSWRGADIRNILNFQKKYKEAKVIKLEQNYRSTKNILHCANSIISDNTQRLGKHLFTENDNGDKVVLYSSNSDVEEAGRVAELLNDLTHLGHKLGDVAILYRTNSQSRLLEEYLRRNGLSYTIVGGLKFYERKEIKDLLAYLKLLVNPRDNISFERIINFPTRGIGAKTVAKFKNEAFIQQKSLLEILDYFNDNDLLKGKAKKSVQDFLNIFINMRKIAESKDAFTTAECMLTESGLKTFYHNPADKNLLERYDNLLELLAGIEEYLKENPKTSLRDYLETVSLLSDIDEYNEASDKVTMMTVHSAKGLEFPYVIITGINDGLFPMLRDFSSDKIEEERRLFYVAITRAEKKLYLSTYKYRHRGFGDLDGYNPSRFLRNIPEEILDKRAYSNFDSSIIRQEIKNRSRKSSFAKKRNESSIQTFTKGDWVFSKQFGEGKILELSRSGNNMVVIVDFDDYGMKKLILKYANLTKIR